MNRALAAFAAALILAALVFAAIPHLAAPDWTVTVVDPAGKPMSGARVREVYRDFNCDSSDHEDTASTNELGVVHFPSQYEHRNALECVMYTLSSAQGGVHATFGSVAYVFAFGPGGEGSPVDTHGDTEQWTGSPPSMKSQITINY